MRKFLISLIAAVTLLVSCASYTVEDGLSRISVPTYDRLSATKLSDIEAEKQLEAEAAEAEAAIAARKKAEEASLLDAQKALEKSINDARILNDYPEDLSLVTYPHVYRPADSRTKLNAAFTRFDILLMPLGQEILSADQIKAAADSVRDTGLEFIVLTGALENQVAFIKEEGMDSVTLPEGSICFTTELSSCEENTATFALTDTKSIDVTVACLRSDITSDAFTDAEALTAYSQQAEELNISGLDEILSYSRQEKGILALSSSEPASSDWSIFTPYTYRTDASWPVSDYLDGILSDVFRATHYSAETDTGITYVRGQLHERLDFIYSKGLIEVSSSVMTIPALSEGSDVSRYAVLATFIVP